jgi:splicing factor 3B subunit 1
MREQQLRGSEAELRKTIQEKSKEGTLKVQSSNGEAKKRGRWDQTADDAVPAKKSASGALTPTWGDTDVSQITICFENLSNFSHYIQKTPADHRWDETPGHRAFGSETPGQTPSARIWDPTPAHNASAATPGRDAEKSRT